MEGVWTPQPPPLWLRHCDRSVRNNILEIEWNQTSDSRHIARSVRDCDKPRLDDETVFQRCRPPFCLGKSTIYMYRPSYM